MRRSKITGKWGYFVKNSERDELLDELLDGSISEADLLRIESELLVDPDVRQTYYNRLQLHVMLEQLASESPVDLSEFKNSQGLHWGNRASLVAGVLIGLAASLIVAFFVLRSTDQPPQMARAASTEESASGFAVLAGQSGAVWKNNSIQVGDLVPVGEVRLESGTVQLELFSGVQMVLSGDCLFSVDSPMQVTMNHGSVRIRVPEPAEGFTIKTSSGDIVDLGTEFALEVSSDRSDVRVIDGEVELRDDKEDPIRVASGNSMRLSRTGPRESIEDQIELIGPIDFQALLRGQQKDRLASWKSKEASIQNDPRLLGHYLLSTTVPQQYELANFASKRADAASAGAIVAAQRTSDRWGRPGKALDFSHIGSRIRVRVDGEHRGLTLNAWVKINSLDRWYNSLFLTDGHEDFEPHWQIMNDGRIFFSVKLPQSRTGSPDEEFQHIYFSPPVWNPSLSGRWMMLSVTYDVDNKRVTHFVNGQSVSREVIEDEDLVEKIRVGASSLCNWSDPQPMYRSDAEFVVRNLNGSMDEFSIYSGALSNDEIRSLFQAGNPNEL